MVPGGAKDGMDSLRITDGTRRFLFCLSAVALGGREDDGWEDENSIFVHTRMQLGKIGKDWGDLGKSWWVVAWSASPEILDSTCRLGGAGLAGEVTLQRKKHEERQKGTSTTQLEHLEHFWKAIRRRIHSIETDGSCGALKGTPPSAHSSNPRGSFRHGAMGGGMGGMGGHGGMDRGGSSEFDPRHETRTVCGPNIGLADTGRRRAGALLSTGLSFMIGPALLAHRDLCGLGSWARR